MKVKCIIVDDEPIARDLLKKYIKDVPALQLVKECSNAFEATEALLQHQVGLIFLDINMPRLSGMAFYRSLSNPPAVIFTTAYTEYALEGFEVEATDYLLKPFSFERFYQAVNRVLERLSSPGQTAAEEYILLKADKKIHRINISGILYIEGLGDYVKVHLPASFLIVHDTLQHIHDSLPDAFVRVHKSYVVCVNHIQYIDGNTAMVSEKEIPIGLKFKEDFLIALKNRSVD